ncbi:MAG: hypothetical protein DGJ47_001039 [Rickettsiaceae bacterium]
MMIEEEYITKRDELYLHLEYLLNKPDILEPALRKVFEKKMSAGDFLTDTSFVSKNIFSAMMDAVLFPNFFYQLGASAPLYKKSWQEISSGQGKDRAFFLKAINDPAGAKFFESNLPKLQKSLNNLVPDIYKAYIQKFFDSDRMAEEITKLKEENASLLNKESEILEDDLNKKLMEIAALKENIKQTERKKLKIEPELNKTYDKIQNYKEKAENNNGLASKYHACIKKLEKETMARKEEVQNLENNIQSDKESLIQHQEVIKAHTVKVQLEKLENRRKVFQELAKKGFTPNYLNRKMISVLKKVTDIVGKSPENFTFTINNVMEMTYGRQNMQERIESIVKIASSDVFIDLINDKDIQLKGLVVRYISQVLNLKNADIVVKDSLNLVSEMAPEILHIYDYVSNKRPSNLATMSEKKHQVEFQEFITNTSKLLGSKSAGSLIVHTQTFLKENQMELEGKTSDAISKYLKEDIDPSFADNASSLILNVVPDLLPITKSFVSLLDDHKGELFNYIDKIKRKAGEKPDFKMDLLGYALETPEVREALASNITNILEKHGEQMEVVANQFLANSQLGKKFNINVEKSLKVLKNKSPQLLKIYNSFQNGKLLKCAFSIIKLTVTSPTVAKLVISTILSNIFSKPKYAQRFEKKKLNLQTLMESSRNLAPESYKKQDPEVKTPQR